MNQEGLSYSVLKTLKLIARKIRKRFWLFRRRLKTQQYLNEHKIRKLQLGAGKNELIGWLNSDIYPKNKNIIFLDIAKPLPFPDNTFDYIFCEHTIEHILFTDAKSMLRESYRILRPGGKIRIATPNLNVYISLFASDRSEMQQAFIQWVLGRFMPEADISHPCFVINNAMRNWGHRFIYDFDILKLILEQSNFTAIEKFDQLESNTEAFKNIEQHGLDVENVEMCGFETLVVEAKRL